MTEDDLYLLLAPLAGGQVYLTLRRWVVMVSPLYRRHG
jgi:hypothetical protein